MKSRHTLLYLPEARRGENQGGVNLIVNHCSVPEQGNTSTCPSAAAVDACEGLLKVILVKYVRVDSCSDITMIDSSVVKSLHMKGSPSRLSMTIVNNIDVKEEGTRGDFKIGTVDSQNDSNVIDVKCAWAVKDVLQFH